MQQQSVIQTSTPGNNVNPNPGKMVFSVPPYVPPEAVRYRDRQSKNLGATMITIGILCIIFNIVSIILTTTGGVGGVSFVGHGIWSGILFIITGSFGVSAAKTKSKCMIITFMVMCIISSVLCTSLLSFGIIGACMATSQPYYQDCSYYNNYYYGYQYGPPYYNVPYCRDFSSMYNAVTAMEACLAFMAVIEAVLAIWGAAICCKAVCCCGRTTAGLVYSTPHYNTNGQVMFVNQQQSGQPLMTSYGPPMYPGVYPIQNQWGYTNVGFMAASDAPSYNQMENPLLAPPTGVPPPMYDNPGATVYNSPAPPFQEKQSME